MGGALLAAADKEEPSCTLKIDKAGERQAAAGTLDDALVDHAGQAGAAQGLVLLAASASWVALACVALAMVFFSSDPVRAHAWSCASAGDAAATAASSTPAAAVAVAAACAELAAAVPPPSAADPAFCALWENNTTINTTINTSSSTSTSPAVAVVFDRPRYSASAEFGLVCGRAWRSAAANSAYFVGIWVGSAPFGRFSDRAGRRACLLAANAACALACALVAAAPDYWLYVAARGLVGFAAAGLPIGGYLLATESMGPKWRGAAGMASQCIYHVGEWLLPLFAVALADWRKLSAALGAVCAACAAAAACVPESPRWLLASGRAQEARAALDWLAKRNGRAVPEGYRLAVDGSAAEDEDGGRDTAQPSDVAPTNGKRDQQQPEQQPEQLQQQQPGAPREQLSAALLFTHPLLRRALLASSAIQCVSALSFFTAGLAADALEGYSVSRAFLVTSLAELPAYVLGVALIDSLGRRATVSAFLAASGASSLGCALLGPGPAQVALATVNRGVISAAWGCAYIVTAEACITPLRAQALGIANQAARMASIAAPAVPLLAAHLNSPALPFAVMAACGLAAAAAALLLPETRGRPQADTVAEYERLYGAGDGGGAGDGSGDTSGGSIGGKRGRGRSGGSVAYAQLPQTVAGDDLGISGDDRCGPPIAALRRPQLSELSARDSAGGGSRLWGSFTSAWSAPPPLEDEDDGGGAGVDARGGRSGDGSGGGCVELGAVARAPSRGLG